MRRILALAMSLSLLYSIATFAGDDKKDNDHPANITVDVRDYCDPISFAAIGCGRDTSTGFITLSGFGQELAADKSVGAWRFAASQNSAEDGANLTIKNSGGELHTFTRVKKFGGGFVAGLNAGSGNNVPAPECAQVVNGNLVPQQPGPDNIFLPAGMSATAKVKEGEVANFQCCIHPWMRTTINAGDEKRGDH